MSFNPSCPMTYGVQETKECLCRWEVVSVKVTKEEETFKTEAKETESQGQEHGRGKVIRAFHFRWQLSMTKMRGIERFSTLSSKCTLAPSPGRWWETEPPDVLIPEGAISHVTTSLSDIFNFPPRASSFHFPNIHHSLYSKNHFLYDVLI